MTEPSSISASTTNLSQLLSVEVSKIEALPRFAPKGQELTFQNGDDRYVVIVPAKPEPTTLMGPDGSKWDLTNNWHDHLQQVFVGDPDADGDVSAYFYFEGRSAADFSVLELPLAGFRLSVAHFNDPHSHFDPIESTIDGIDVSVGGMPLLASAVIADRREDAAQGLASVSLLAGDALEGSLDFLHFQGRRETALLNVMGLDGMALGNHEFNRVLGNAGLARWVESLNFPVVAANLDFSQSPSLSVAPISPFTVLQIDDQRVGLIGVITPDTYPQNTDSDLVTVTDPIVAVQNAVDALQAQGVDKIIALSHLGFPYDQSEDAGLSDLDLAANVRGLDLIVGGHSHFNMGKSAPRFQKDPDGKFVPIVQAGDDAQYLGHVDLWFGEDGQVLAYRAGVQRLVDASLLSQSEVKTLAANPAVLLVTPEESVQSAMAPFESEIAPIKNRALRNLPDNLKTELNSGPGQNMANALLAATQAQGVTVAMINGSSVRVRKWPAGALTVGDVYTAFPFNDPVKILEISGADLITALENFMDDRIQKGRKIPLYAAGLRFTCQKSAAKGQRLSDVKIQNADGDFMPLDPSARYKIAVNDYLAGPGGHLGLSNLQTDTVSETQRNATEVLVDYLQQNNPFRGGQGQILLQE